MASAERDPVRRAGRWVSVRLQHRDVRIQGDTGDECVSYAGIVITSFENGAEVGERWIPLGGDPSEADDEQLIQQLRDALIWQARRPPKAAGE
ncbi:hypothetical protein [Amycolatopsis azurea]|uniref:Uncharacterized protein n=1 Tax=Amycolatopsis azurea DSM 43854 TaxID=1238180 RepID=M2PQU8_9PSEU|nr:hypothetical protein [Amycolatopsis azurea]EMD21905.1 hypothetical protein C791_0712 [Amycolatopsis azurea DSM 43854]OOC02163.1 hypothetical protein B0293_34900 [Amycolatopsis azurea DSM 43854]